MARKKPKTLHRLKHKSYVAQIILILLGAELLFLSSFTAFSLPTATAHNWQRYAIRELHKLYCHLPQSWQTKLQLDFSTKLGAIISPDSDTQKNMRYSLYVPQAPVAVFLGYVLGWPLAAIAAALYILLGLFGPFIHVYPFASGSGLNYYLQPGFGYMLGMVLAAACVGYISRKERTSKRQLLSLLAGLLCVHGIGLTYMLGICLFDTIYDANAAQLTWSGWLFDEARNLSWYALPYDFIFSLALIGIGFPLRWLAATLIAPDIGTQNETSENENLVNFRPATK